MKENKDIVAQLNEIVFHDIPVERICFKPEKLFDLVIDCGLYKEDVEDYEYWSLEFIGTEDMNPNIREIEFGDDMEIYDFDYEFNNFFYCKIIILTGFSKPTYEINFFVTKLN